MMQEDKLQWERKGDYNWKSVSVPQYTIGAFKIGNNIIYRASMRGGFIGTTTTCPDKARQICQNNFIIQGSMDEDLPKDE